MKHTIQLALVFICCFATSCEQKNASQETQSLQHHDDSLKAAIEAEVNGHLQRQNDSLKNALTDNTPQVKSPQNTEIQQSVDKQPQAGLGNKENDLIDAKLQLGKLNTLLINLKAKSEYESNELNKAEQFHLGRTKTEREQQIRQQSIRVQTYQNAIQKVQDAIITLNNKINGLQNDISKVN